MSNNTEGIILAGGKSERMGVAKGMLKYGKTFWVLEQITRLGHGGIKKVHIGLGFNYEHYFWGIDWFENAVKNPVHFMGVSVSVHVNQTPELGPFSTLHTILKKVNNHSSVIINPIDIPVLNNRELSQIIETTGLAVLPNYNGKNGHPIKLHSNFWNSFLELQLSGNNSRLDLQIKSLAKEQITTLEVKDSSVVKNMNTPNEWKAFLKEK